MRKLLIAILLQASTAAFAGGSFIFSSGNTAGPEPAPQQTSGSRPSGNVQKAECYPTGDYARNWPVDAIYLHGLFPASGGDPNGFRGLELSNRRKLMEMADRLKIKIAIPVSPSVSKKTGDRYWDPVSLDSIERAAKAACGSPLAKPRAIIGFSNGGYKARDISNLSCGEQSAYSKILIIGAPSNKKGGNCGNKVRTDPHEMPGMAYFNTHLGNLARRTAAPAGSDTAPAANR